MALTTKEISELKAQAHTLEPIVRVGKTGLSETVIEEINKHLKKRRLIKVRVLKTLLETQSKEQVKVILEDQLKCQVLAFTGFILILYR